MEKHNNLPPQDPNTICRICLLEKNVPFSLQNDDNTIVHTIEKCTNIKIILEPSHPSSICEDCFYHLNIAYQFKNDCEQSEKYFRCLHKEQEILNGYRLACEMENNDVTDTINPQNTKEKTSCFVKDSFHISLETDPIKKEIHKIDSIAFGDDNTRTSDNMDPNLSEDSNAVYEKEQIENNNKSNATCRTEYSVKSEANQVERIVNKKAARSCTSEVVKRDKLKIPEQCSHCGKVFPYSGYLETHMRVHTGEKPFECHICKVRFTQANNLSLHMRVHTGEKPFQCEICSKRCSTSSNLRAHQRTHSDQRDFACPQCERCFKSAAQLSSHTATHSGIKNFHCPDCDKAFYKIAYLNVHIRTVHNGEKRHSCAECGKTFKNSSNLICHFRIHTGEKPFVCDICDTPFNQSSALTRHKKLHEVKNLYERQTKMLAAEEPEEEEEEEEEDMGEEMNGDEMEDVTIAIDVIEQISDTQQDSLIVTPNFLSPSIGSIQSDVELNVDDSQQIIITNDYHTLSMEDMDTFCGLETTRSMAHYSRMHSNAYEYNS